jgi:Zn-dependent M28 family amino/carboxypeptidase
MCYKPFEHYEPPNKTKSPSFILPEIHKKLESRRTNSTKDTFLESKLSLISTDKIHKSIVNLSSFHNRHSKSQYIDSVANWLKNELINIGYNNENINFHTYSESGFNLKNVICTKKGTNPDKTILLCAHYDTILNRDPNDAISRQPGANDNASGVASLLEISRIIFGIDLKNTIQFVFFSGEEQGLWGSTHYSQYLKDNDIDLHVVVNLDMCSEPGFLSTLTTANVDIDDGQTGVVSYNNESSQNFGLLMKDLGEIYTNLSIEFDPIDASDYMPFEARGYICIGAYDGAAKSSNPHYHSDTDVITNLDLSFLTNVDKMTLAFVLNESK